MPERENENVLAYLQNQGRLTLYSYAATTGFQFLNGALDSRWHGNDARRKVLMSSRFSFR